MSLIGNYSVLSKTPGRFLSGTSLSGDRSNFNKSGQMRNRFAGDNSKGMSKLSAIPNGYLAPYTWSLPQTGGGLAAYTSSAAIMSLTTSQLAAGVNATSNIAATISLTDARLDQIANLLSSISGSIGVTDAQLAAVAGLQAELSASMSITSAQIGAIIDLIASLSAQGTFTSSNIFATANMSSDIGGPVGLTADSVASAVWDSLLASYSTPGSAGQTFSSIQDQTSEIENIKKNTDLIPATI